MTVEDDVVELEAGTDAAEARDEAADDSAEDADDQAGDDAEDPEVLDDIVDESEEAFDESDDDDAMIEAEAEEMDPPVDADDGASETLPEPVEAFQQARMVEALLFAAAGPLSDEELARRLPEGFDVPAAIATLHALYEGRGVELECVAGRWRFRTAVDLAYLMTEEREDPRRLSKAALETLAIIAYHQPVTRAEIEQIRGVSLSRGTLDLLLEMNFVRLRGRRRTPGRPVTYATTDAFLEHFGLANLMDLPGHAEMKAAGLLDMTLPAGFEVPTPGLASSEEEDPVEEGDDGDAEFAQDFIGAEDKGEG